MSEHLKTIREALIKALSSSHKLQDGKHDTREGFVNIDEAAVPLMLDAIKSLDLYESELREAALLKTDIYLQKLEPGEPAFLLMGRDPFTPAAIYKWIEDATRAGVSEEKLRQAYAIASAAEVWAAARTPEVAE